MSWYPIDGVSFLVPGTFRHEYLDERVVACFSGPWIVDRQSINLSVALAHHQQSKIDLGLDQRLDWREWMSWPTLHGVTATARGSAQSEPWDSGNDWPWWCWDPGGLIDDRCSERSVWDPDIEGYVPGDLTQEHSNTQGFVWDPGIGPIGWPTYLDCLRESNLGAEGL